MYLCLLFVRGCETVSIIIIARCSIVIIVIAERVTAIAFSCFGNVVVVSIVRGGVCSVIIGITAARDHGSGRAGAGGKRRNGVGLI